MVKGQQTSFAKGQKANIIDSIATVYLCGCAKAARDNTYMSPHGYVPIKHY